MRRQERGNPSVPQRVTTAPSPATCGPQCFWNARAWDAPGGTAMPDLLIELLSEEIPARMQARAADDLKKLVTDRLAAAGLLYEGAKAFATPRRLALAVAGVPAQQPDVKEEK